MLFLLKRTWPPALAALVALAALGIGVRMLRGSGPELGLSLRGLLLGVAVAIGVLASDVGLHGLCCLLFGESYRRPHRALAAIYRDQQLVAIAIGALLAGIGEELVFRGLSRSPYYLCGGAVVFGLLHHVRRDLWPFTIWAAWEGMLFATALFVTELLAVTMVAHFLHDLMGFLIFRYLNRVEPRAPSVAFRN
jgi:membrane protease YdiL (CAAX protease family)